MERNINTKMDLQQYRFHWPYIYDRHPHTLPTNLWDSLVSFSFNCNSETTNAVTSLGAAQS